MQDTQDKMALLLKKRDTAAIGQLYDTYGAILYGVVLRIVDTESMAQQVVQDTFIKASRFGDQYDESKERLFTWLLNIARKTAINMNLSTHLRDSNKTESLDALVQTPGIAFFNPNTLELKESVQKMDENNKQIIDLIYIKGYTQEEASEVTGLQVSTIRTRMKDAILEIRGTFA